MDNATIEKAREIFESIERKNKEYDLQRYGAQYVSDSTRNKWELFLTAYQMGYEAGRITRK